LLPIDAWRTLYGDALGKGALRAGSICAAIAHTNRKARRVDGLVLPVCDLRIADAYSKCRRAPWLQRHYFTSPPKLRKGTDRNHSPRFRCQPYPQTSPIQFANPAMPT